MAIPVYTPPTRSIALRGSDEALIVRGLSLEDLTRLLDDNMPVIVSAVEKYRDSLTSFYAKRKLDDFLASVMLDFPGLAADVIAVAANDPAGGAPIRKWPAAPQMAALIAIAELTLDDMGALSDPSPALASLVRRVTGVLTQTLKNSSAAITGPSDDPSPVLPVPGA